MHVIITLKNGVVWNTQLYNSGGSAMTAFKETAKKLGYVPKEIIYELEYLALDIAWLLEDVKDQLAKTDYDVFWDEVDDLVDSK